ncbi:hypothetical protein [Allomesorhizobium alhagi]|uniref:hypothetical protein n=1 Tax=Allomesorhizobium alhagi TaxID=475067 RepID=UPI0002DDF25A|nr:hypothetical protein [Mesorhizobium alhagi]
MALNQRPDREQLNLIVLADGFGWKIFDRLARQQGHWSRCWSMMRSASSLSARLCPLSPGLAPPGFAFPSDATNRQPRLK